MWSRGEDSLQSAFQQVFPRRVSRLGGSIPHDISLQMFYMRTQFPEAFGLVDGESPSAAMKRMERAAKQSYPFAEGLQLWGTAASEAIALVLFEPAVAQRLIASHFTPQEPASWKRAHDAGLDIPPSQDELSEGDHLAMLAELLQPYFADEHPELIDLFD